MVTGKGVLKTIGIIIFFIVFFEVGIISSYTIVTSEAPDIGEIFQMQIDFLGNIFSMDTVNTLTGGPEQLNITNEHEVSTRMAELLKTIDGIDVKNLNVTTTEDLSGDKIAVNITTLGYPLPSGGSNITTTISLKPSIRIKATAEAKETDKGVEIITSTIKIVESITLT